MTATEAKSDTWEEALADQRELGDEDDGVLLYHYGKDGKIDGRIFFGPHQAQDTECDVRPTPRHCVSCIASDLNEVLSKLGLPLHGWT